MGNIISIPKHQRLKATKLEETGFESFTEVSSSIRGGCIEVVTDESCGEASNLLKPAKAIRLLNLNDLSDYTDGWLTKRHELVASVTITLCNESKIAGFDIDTTGYTDSSPSIANVEGYHSSSLTWQVILPESRINADSHNFFEIKDSDVYSSVRLTVAPGGGVARFRVYGEISPDWSNKTKDYNLASANLGARIVRWTDQRNANKPNILLDDGTKMADGWLTPRSRLEKERNDFVLIQLATTGIIESITIDTTGFEHNSPQNVFIQGCYSGDVDPHYDSFASWVCLVPQSPVLPGGETTFYFNVKDPITHIRLHLIPDGGIQQIKVIGKPAKKETKQTLLIEQASEEDGFVEVMLQQEEEEAIVSMLEEQLNSRSAVEQLNVVDHLSKRIRKNE